MRRYTSEQKEFLRSFIPGHTSEEVAREFTGKFGEEMTACRIKAYKTNNKIKSGTQRGKKLNGTIYPPDVREFLIRNNKGKTAREMSDMLFAEFGVRYTVKQIKGIRSRMKLDSGLTGRFERGHVPANKGERGKHYAGCEKTWFRKGHKPHNHVPVNTVVMTTDGYLKRKVDEPDVWRFVHIMEWEKHNGPVPEGCLISFRDGDHRNCDISNLFCCTRAEHAVMNKNKLRFPDKELTETGLFLSRLAIRTRDLSRKK